MHEKQLNLKQFVSVCFSFLGDLLGGGGVPPVIDFGPGGPAVEHWPGECP